MNATTKRWITLIATLLIVAAAVAVKKVLFPPTLGASGFHELASTLIVSFVSAVFVPLLIEEAFTVADVASRDENQQGSHGQHSKHKDRLCLAAILLFVILSAIGMLKLTDVLFPLPEGGGALRDVSNEKGAEAKGH